MFRYPSYLVPSMSWKTKKFTSKFPTVSGKLALKYMSVNIYKNCFTALHFLLNFPLVCPKFPLTSSLILIFFDFFVFFRKFSNVYIFCSDLFKNYTKTFTALLIPKFLVFFFLLHKILRKNICKTASESPENFYEQISKYFSKISFEFVVRTYSSISPKLIRISFLLLLQVSLLFRCFVFPVSKITISANGVSLSKCLILCYRKTDWNKRSIIAPLLVVYP